MRLLFILSLCFSILACAGPGIKSITSAAELGSDEIIVVGQIRLEPKFVAGEQSFDNVIVINKDSVEGKVLLIFDQQHKPLQDYMSFSGIEKMASVPFRKNFMVAAKRTQPLIFSGAFYTSHMSNREAGQIYLPGGLQLNYDKNDRAIYMGTLVFHRNDYDEITKVELLNEYTSANREFKKLYGDSIKLKAIKPVLLEN